MPILAIMNELQIYDPEQFARDQKTVSNGFWAKLRRTLGRIPFADEAVAAWFCASDPSTPARVKAVLIGALAYFVMPADLVPDVIAGLGFTDDAAVLMAAVTTVGTHIKDAHRDQAKAVLKRLAGA